MHFSCAGSYSRYVEKTRSLVAAVLFRQTNLITKLMRSIIYLSASHLPGKRDCELVDSDPAVAVSQDKELSPVALDGSTLVSKGLVFVLVFVQVINIDRVLGA